MVPWLNSESLWQGEFISVKLSTVYSKVNKALPSAARSSRSHWQSVRSLIWLVKIHWGRYKMAAIFQTAFSNAFLWMKMYKFWLIFHWGLFPRVHLTIFQHWFRYCLGAGQATSHYLNQWLVYWRIFIAARWCLCASVNLFNLGLGNGLSPVQR